MSDTIAPNIPYLRKIVEWVESEASRSKNREWYQATWMAAGEEIQGEEELGQVIHFCDTACCVAGKVALLEGWKPEVYSNSSGFTGNVIKDGETRHTSHVARDVLGLTPDQADDLFEANNSARDIREVAEEIAGERL